MAKEYWYDLDYEDETGDCAGVLYTSRASLKRLVEEMTRISEQDEEGRHQLILEDIEIDNEYELPFTYIDVREKPPKESFDETSEQWKKPLFYLAAVIFIVGFLTLYGLVRLVIDIV